VERGESLGNRAERLPEHFIGKAGHWQPAALALAVKRADHVVG
jgi:hypothetical protein